MKRTVLQLLRHGQSKSLRGTAGQRQLQMQQWPTGDETTLLLRSSKLIGEEVLNNIPFFGVVQ